MALAKVALLPVPVCLSCRSKVQEKVWQYGKGDFYDYFYHIANVKVALLAVGVCFLWYSKINLNHYLHHIAVVKVALFTVTKCLSCRSKVQQEVLQYSIVELFLCLYPIAVVKVALIAMHLSVFLGQISTQTFKT